MRATNPTMPRQVEKVDWERWKFTEDAVLSFIREGDRLMLIHKKTGLGKGKINAPGGRVQEGERLVDAAVRETREEIALTPHDPRLVAELQFVFTDGYSLHGFVFMAYSYEGTPTETREADPFWCHVEQIPYHQMWEDDRFWLPRVLAGEKVLGRFVFEADRMLSHRILPLPPRNQAF
ncbi:MAG: NUDIX domain-containing protein [Chitinivibrionales bacterium]|nr:NUDIX domain-containing protein [Chitinivibrionales bacterium]MBD3356831.1 NUDIX domain-containing protein [Chitinivibrionales bacterium]